jgi:UDP-N-acetylglucosamine diphosphorylase/glucosamine-1-phosphate N-acetyltransferase
MNYILFDGPRRDYLLPFTYTRPVCEIRTGILTLREKWEKYLKSQVSWLTQPYLQEKYPLVTSEDNILIHGAMLPTPALLSEVMALGPLEGIVIGGEIIAARLPGYRIIDFSKDHVKGMKIHERGIPVKIIRNVWDIFLFNGDEILADFALLAEGKKSSKTARTNTLINASRIFFNEGATAQGAILNATHGPVYIGRHAEIMEGAIIRGPFAMGDYSVVKIGAKIYEETTLGPHCKVGGEVKNSVFFGYSNKQHEGYLGNAVLGEWCNIGAGSNNSNLKNTYGHIKVWSHPEEKFIDSGLQFCGLFMGDHSKCGIQTMFNTGTTIGVCVNIFGSGFPRNFIPSFSWGGSQGFSEYRLDKVFEMASLVMERRGMKLDDKEKRILSHVFALTQNQRIGLK